MTSNMPGETHYLRAGLFPLCLSGRAGFAVATGRYDIALDKHVHAVLDVANLNVYQPLACVLSQFAMVMSRTRVQELFSLQFPGKLLFWSLAAMHFSANLAFVKREPSTSASNCESKVSSPGEGGACFTMSMCVSHTYRSNIRTHGATRAHQ